jgi:L-amino acid N-acyltransferase YncA
MPAPIDKLDRKKTHNAISVVNTGTPSSNETLTLDEVMNITYNKQNVLVINVKPSLVGATATITIWVYDKFLGWIPAKDETIPRPGYDNTYPTPIYFNTKFQTAGITLKTLSGGTVTITACFVCSDTV